MFFPFSGSHQKNTAPMQKYVKDAGAGKTPNPAMSTLSPMTPPKRPAGEDSQKKPGGGDFSFALDPLFMMLISKMFGGDKRG
jgi:hypothetical protein